MVKKQEVLIFYSSLTESNLLNSYSESIDYLRKLNINTKVIDVVKNRKFVEKYDIITTPLLIIKKSGKIYKYFDPIEGLENMLTRDLYGKGILNVLGFKEGRKLGRKLKVKKQKGIENSLNNVLGSRGLHDFRLVKFNAKNNYSKVRGISDIARVRGKSKTPVCFSIAAFLGGIFTEIFNKGVHFKETKCMVQGYDGCEFETIKEDIKKTEKAVKKWLLK
ncbi:4-vinyl reductase [Candidatus Woesearchaeota archaeon]|nr:4-vinyl reductase [Candidatus Woesearchaeota archaeon]